MIFMSPVLGHLPFSTISPLASLAETTTKLYKSAKMISEPLIHIIDRELKLYIIEALYCAQSKI